MSERWRHWAEAPRTAPWMGAAIGSVGGGAYWLGTQVWPTSVAVVLAMLATALIGARTTGATGGMGATALVFAVLVKYNVLMALSAASLPFALPANLALGFIMIAGHASSHALAATVSLSPSPPASTQPSHVDLVVALLFGFAPAVLMGMPGLIGLAAAILARIAFVARRRRNRSAISPMFEMTRQLTEACFYLGALATRAYV